MSQIRFNIGVPRGGSAARAAEDDSTALRPQSLRPQGGSAARMAEDRDRLEGVPTRRSVTIGLRAQGGRTAESADSAVPSVASITRHTSSPEPSSISAGSTLAAAPLSADPAFEETASSQPPHSVAARIQSLAKSLFSPGASTAKPN